MRNAETILGIIRERGTRGLPLENVYRFLYNREFYLRAYNRIYRNKGVTNLASAIIRTAFDREEGAILRSTRFTKIGRKAHELQPWDISPSLALAALVVGFASDIPFIYRVLMR